MPSSPEPALRQDDLNLFSMADNAVKKSTEEDLFYVFRPLFLVQSILGSSRVRLTDAGLSEPSWIAKLYSLSYYAVSWILCYLVLKNGAYLYFVVPLQLMFFCSFYKTNNFEFIGLFRRLVDLNFELQFSMIDRPYNYLHFWNCIYAGFVSLTIVLQLVLVTNDISLGLLNIWGVTYLFIQIILSVCIMASFVCVNFLAINIQIMRGFRLSLTADSGGRAESPVGQHGAAGGRVRARRLPVGSVDACRRYDRIMSTYRTFADAFQLEVMMLLLNVVVISITELVIFTHNINYDESTLPKQHLYTLDRALAFITCLLVCYFADRMMKENNSLEAFLVEKIHTNNDARERRRVKALLVLVQATPREFTLYRLFSLDAGFVLNLVVVIATYSIVVIQFMSLDTNN